MNSEKNKKQTCHLNMKISTFEKTPYFFYSPIPEISNLSAEQYALVLFVLGGMHNAFCFLVVISYFVGNHPRLPDPKAAFLEIK